MESPAKRLEVEAGSVGDARRRSDSEPDVPDAPVEVMDIVQHGAGRGSRIELTIVASERWVRLAPLRAKDVLSYRRVASAAMEQGVVLPWLRPANEIWRGILRSAMEHARIEPSLEGEEVATPWRRRSGAGSSTVNADTTRPL